MGKHRKDRKNRKVHVDGGKEDDVENDGEEECSDEEIEEPVPIKSAPKKSLYRIQSKSNLSSLKSHSKTSPLKKTLTLISALHITGSGQVTSDVCEKCGEERDMPGMHYAAYNGHAPCLQAFLKRDVPPPEMDATDRTALFYACAANRVECVSLILQLRSDWINRTDSQKDTCAHVCCFFGRYECLKHILAAGGNPHAINSKGFRPSHIAKNKECLELLLSYGDDLQQGDELGRTPLFVSCARKREDCVEFLCAWAYQSQSWMIEQCDDRGDFPLHAAACNGCLGCVQVNIK